MFVESIPGDTETQRYCPGCDTLKDFSEFYKDGTDGNGNTKYRRDCKACYKATRSAEKQAKRAAKAAEIKRQREAEKRRKRK